MQGIPVIHGFVTTTNDIEGYTVRTHLGVVRGLIVRSPTILGGFVGGMQSIFGGNISAYAEQCEQARGQAYDLMVQHAIERGANAIIGMRYDATEFSDGITEVLAYGTAVVLEPKPGAG